MNLLPFLFSGPLHSPAGKDLLCKESYLLRNNPYSVPPPAKNLPVVPTVLRVRSEFHSHYGQHLECFLYSTFTSKKKKNQTNSSHAFMIPGLFLFSSNSCFLSTLCVLIPVLGARVVMYRCETWTIKKAECQRIDAFELWCWRTLESSVDRKEIKPVNPKGNQP